MRLGCLTNTFAARHTSWFPLDWHFLVFLRMESWIMPSSFLVPNCRRQLLAQITRSRTSYKLHHSFCMLGAPTLMFPFARGQVFVPWRLKGGPFKLRCRKSAKECCKTAGRLTAKFDPPWDGNGCRNCVVSGRPFRESCGRHVWWRRAAVAQD